MFNTPILFLVFNRPDTTARVFEQIRKIKPAHLYVAADGPRKDKPGEKAICDEVRKIVLSGVDWECEVKTLFRDKNLGSGNAVSNAITWFFENVEGGIILEDDVLPTQSFFLFCARMLVKFKDEHRIMQVSGNNFQFSKIGVDCYYLSKLPHTWGWATWKRAWEKFNFELKDFNEDKVNNYFDYLTIDTYWHHIFKLTKRDLYHHVWDYQWVFAVFTNNGLSITPQNNLVSNIGFGDDSTHTSDINDFLANLKSYEMEIDIGHTIVSYDPIPDINFHKLFKWENIETPVKNLSVKDSMKLLLKKLQSIKENKY